MKRIYRKSPLAQVVCEFNFKATGWDISVPGQLFARVREEFPDKSSTRHFTIDRDPKAELPAPRLVTTDRLRFANPQSSRSWTVGENFLAIGQDISLQHPYHGWDTMRPLIENGYSQYCEVAAPQALQRISLRYVNRFEQPLFAQDTVSLGQYFQFHPQLGPDLPPEGDSFLMGVDFARGEACRLRVEMSTQGSADGQDVLALALACISRAESIEPGQAMSWLDSAHEHIWTAFEACLTSEMKDRMEPHEVEE